VVALALAAGCGSAGTPTTVRVGPISATLHECGVASMMGTWVEQGHITVVNRDAAPSAVRVRVTWRRGQPGGLAFEEDRVVAGAVGGEPGQLVWTVWSDTDARGPERAIACRELVSGLDLLVAGVAVEPRAG
jgi:hypothetical protein